uniref:Uncharacterized protein n=1 Tax=Meloidogyne floridensis TaxID=298350 RepID=A0A915NKH3_9BILA
TFMISEIMATGASQQQLEAEVRLCCIIQVKMWPIENKVPLSTTALIEVLKMTRSWRKRAPDRPESRPTIVMSHNGVSRCGIFIAANVLIDQMEMDHEVDVFHAVKLIRLNRPQLIDGPRTRFTGDAKDEYKYLYDLMLHWYMTNPELRSFEPPEADSLGSDDGSSDESIGESQSLGTNRRSIRSGNTRSIQRSKSSRASRRTITTANSLIHGGTEIGGTTTQRNSNETSNEQKKRMEPVNTTSPRHGGELVAEVLKAHDIKEIFTLCGGHISPILVACENFGIKVYDTRHEVNAVFAADCVARLRQNIGVAVVTAGPGVTNSITGLKNAQMAESPLLLIGGAAPTLLRGRGALQDINQQVLIKPLCKFSTRVRAVCDIIPTLRQI